MHGDPRIASLDKSSASPGIDRYVSSASLCSAVWAADINIDTAAHTRQIALSYQSHYKYYL